MAWWAMIVSVSLQVWLGVLACSGSAPPVVDGSTDSTSVSDSGPSGETSETGASPSDTAPTTRSTGDTSHTGIDLGDPLMLYSSSGEWCMGPDPYLEPELRAQGSPDTVHLGRVGQAGGCSCTGYTPEGWLDEAAATITMQWNLGDCDVLYCCSLRAELRGVPPGTYTVDEWIGGGSLSTTVTVP